MSLYRLDVAAVYERLDKQRIARGLSWREMGRLLDISGSTFSRMTHGKRPDADALVTMKSPARRLSRYLFGGAV